MTKSQERLAAMAFGVVFLVVIIVLTLVEPDPTDYAAYVFTTVLALAAAGVATMLPGFISVEIGGMVRATGGIGVFLIVLYWGLQSKSKVSVENGPGFERDVIGAIESGNVTALKGFLKDGLSVETRVAAIYPASAGGHYEFKVPLVTKATTDGQLDIVKVLLEAGADPDATEQLEKSPSGAANWIPGTSPLLFLSEFGAPRGELPIAEALLDHGADIDFVDTRGQSATMNAIRTGRTDLANLLLERGADTGLRNTEGYDALFVAAIAGDARLVKQIAKRHPDRINARSVRGETALLRAANNGHIDVVRALLDAGADVDALNEHRWSPLMLAAVNGHEDIVRLLLSRGANTRTVSSGGSEGNPVTALAFAVGSGQENVVQALLSSGADVNQRFGKDRRALHVAAISDRTKIVDLLVAYGASVNAHDFRDQTALHLSAGAGQLNNLKALLVSGADVDSTDDLGVTALHIAAARQDVAMVNELIASGADRSARTNAGYTFAEYFQDSELGRKLAAKYAN